MKKLNGLLKKIGLVQFSEFLRLIEKNKQHFFREGFKRGYEQAESDRHPSIHLSYKPISYNSALAATHIVPPSKLGFTTNINNQIEKEVFTSKIKGGFEPKDSQKKLIISSSRNILVNAGAGSGKSTTLVQRVYVMHKYLAIPLSHITVFSFTRASCADFRTKLQKYFEEKGIHLTADDLRSIVRTFHSKIYSFASNSFAGSKPKVFEFLSDNKGSEKETLEIDNIQISDLGKQQREILRNVYRDLYDKDREFRKLMDDLEHQSWMEDISLRDDYPDARKNAEKNITSIVKRDRMLTKSCYKRFADLPPEREPVAFNLDSARSGMTMHANYFYKEYNLYVVIVPDRKSCEKYKWDREKVLGSFSFRASCRNKLDVLLQFSAKEIFFVRSDDDVRYLNRYLRSLQNPYASDASFFEIMLNGEYSPNSIFEAFYQLGTFIDSLGILVNDIKPHMEKAKLPSIDALFMKGLILYWEAFQTQLQVDNCFRFSDFFRAFSDPKSEYFSILPLSILNSMQHIIIDEFQDISPIEVNWIHAVMRYQQSLKVNNSIICAGDDYQSIYGWRGGSTAFILKYLEKFPSKNHESLTIYENFRSFTNIVEPAERVLDEIPKQNRTHKKGLCQKGVGGNGIKIITEYEQDDIIKYLWALEDEFFSTENNSNDEPFVLVLARSNLATNKVKKAFLEQKRPERKLNWPVRFETFHRSKGLEADQVVLLDDCSYSSNHYLRNLIYELAEIGNSTYDESQRDEAWRLAYVAITRAKHSLRWYTKIVDSGAAKIVSRHSLETITNN